jgi:hypothetical protein
MHSATASVGSNGDSRRNSFAPSTEKSEKEMSRCDFRRIDPFDELASLLSRGVLKGRPIVDNSGAINPVR